MAVEGIQNQAYTDIQALGDLKRQARANDPAAMRETARQFETLFAKMMLKSMREASGGDELFDTEESQMYRSMFDDQLALELTQGKGLGIADMLVQQLMRAEVANQAATGSPERVPLNPLRSELPKMPAVTEVRAATAAVPPAAGSREAFIEAIRPAAERAAKSLGVSPRAIMAQAALETGWGRSMPVDESGRSSFNLFGIKATGNWRGPVAVSATTEFVDRRAVQQTERFRAYDSIEQSVQDHARLLSGSSRYAAALNSGDDIQAYATALQRGGYATDPNYARKLVGVAESLDKMLGGART